MTNQVEEIEAEIVEEVDGAVALSAMTRAEIDMQIATAQRFKRSMKEFKRQAMELATLDEETASSMFYALPRGGKTIQGMSVRLAEVAQSCWGNCRSESDVIAIDDKYVTAMGAMFDLEKNVATRITVRRRITDKYGKRFNDDMIAVTANAACSIALREAILKVIPRALLKDIYQAAISTAVGDLKSLSERRSAAVEWFSKVGIGLDKICNKLGRKGLDDINLDDLQILTGLRTAIKDGEVSADNAFDLDQPAANKKQSDGAAELQSALESEPDWATIEAQTKLKEKQKLSNGGVRPAVKDEPKKAVQT